MENLRSPGTKVPGNFRSRTLSFPGTFVPIFACAVLYQQFRRSNSVGRRVKLLEDVGFMFKYLSITVV